MVIQLSGCVKPCLLRHHRRSVVPSASLHHSPTPTTAVSRRYLLSQTASLSLLSVSVATFPLPASSSEEALSEWERVYLPVDPGVVLLDVAFVPDDPNHGFLLGTRQTILETKDGGDTWASRSIPSAEDEDFNYRFNSISFKGKEGWIVGKPAILLYTSDAGDTWDRIPLSAQLPGDMVYIKATGEKSAEMVTDEGAIYITSNKGYNWRAAVQETVSATLNRTVSSGISGASYYTGTFNTVNRSPDGRYVAVSSRGNFYLTWEPGQPFWQPHNRAVARRIQNMGWRADGGLWLLVRGGGLYLSKGKGVTTDILSLSILIFEHPNFTDLIVTNCLGDMILLLHLTLTYRNQPSPNHLCNVSLNFILGSLPCTSSISERLIAFSFWLVPKRLIGYF